MKFSCHYLFFVTVTLAASLATAGYNNHVAHRRTTNLDRVHSIVGGGPNLYSGSVESAPGSCFAFLINETRTSYEKVQDLSDLMKKDPTDTALLYMAGSARGMSLMNIVFHYNNIKNQNPVAVDPTALMYLAAATILTSKDTPHSSSDSIRIAAKFKQIFNSLSDLPSENQGLAAALLTFTEAIAEADAQPPLNASKFVQRYYATQRVVAAQRYKLNGSAATAYITAATLLLNEEARAAIGRIPEIDTVVALYIHIKQILPSVHSSHVIGFLTMLAIRNRLTAQKVTQYYQQELGRQIDATELQAAYMLGLREEFLRSENSEWPTWVTE